MPTLYAFRLPQFLHHAKRIFLLIEYLNKVLLLFDNMRHYGGIKGAYKLSLLNGKAEVGHIHVHRVVQLIANKPLIPCYDDKIVV